MKKNLSSHELINEAMRSVATSEAPEGMESRIVGRLRAAAAEPSAQKAIFSALSWRLPLVASLAVVALCVFLFRPAAKVQPPRPQPASRSTVAAVHSPTTVLLPPHPMRTVAVQARHARRRVAELASYPAPPQPLTAEEKLLLKCVHENQPQVMQALSLIATNDNPLNESPNINPGDHE